MKAHPKRKRMRGDSVAQKSIEMIPLGCGELPEKDRLAFRINIREKAYGFRFACTELGFREENGEHAGMFLLVDYSNPDFGPAYFETEKEAWDAAAKAVGKRYEEEDIRIVF